MTATTLGHGLVQVYDARLRFTDEGLIVRSGIYAVVDGIEFEASLFSGGVAIYIPTLSPAQTGGNPRARNHGARL